MPASTCSNGQGFRLTKNSVVSRWLRKLIVRGRILADRERETRECELEGFKRSALDCLALLGSPVDGLRQEISSCDFGIHLSAGRFGDLRILEDVPAYTTLDRIVRLLRMALRVVDDNAAPFPAAAREGPPAGITDREPLAETGLRSPYSHADDLIFECIGRQALLVMTNADLTRRHRRTAEKLLQRPLSADAFRAALDRIRRRHGFPLSRQIQKNSLSSPRVIHQN